MSQVIPVGWYETTLGKLSNIQSGVGFPKKYQGKMEGTYPVYKVGDVSKGVLNNKGILTKAEYYVSETEAIEMKGKIFEVGSTLFAKIGEAVKLNRRGFVKVAGLADNNVMAVKAHLSEMDQWTHYYLNTIDLATVSRSTTVPSVRKGDIEELTVNLPPLAEQKVIVDKLGELLAQVESTKARLDAIPAILKSFRQSVLAAAVSGKLTEEWRGIEVKNWHYHELKDLCTSISDGDHQAPPKADKGVPFLVISNVNNGEINFDKVSRWVPDTYYDSLKDIRKPQLNDILYTVTGSLGIPVIVKTDKPFCFQRHIAILKPNHSIINYQYLELALKAPDTFEHATNIATGTAQKTVSLTSLRKFNFSIPPLDEQTEIVRRVEELFAFADKVEAQVNVAQTRVNNLTQSILAKAFRGELTADWRTDNPDLISGENSAEALLERIKAGRESLQPKRKVRKKN